MYVPEPFAVRDEAKLRRFVQENPFATLVCAGGGALSASHIPLLIDHPEGPPARLIGHLARANPQWEDLERGEILLIFHGPHAYISPFWYERQEAVPTWNYAAVHIRGRARLVHDLNRAREMVEALTAQFERERLAALHERWSPAFLEKMLKGIVAFEIEVTRLEGKFKLGQNRSPGDIAGTYEGLRKSDDPSARALAELMRLEGISPPS